MIQFVFTGGPGCLLLKNFKDTPSGLKAFCNIDVLKSLAFLYKDVRSADIYMQEYGFSADQMNDLLKQFFDFIYIAKGSSGVEAIIDCSQSNCASYPLISHFLPSLNWSGLMISPWTYFQLRKDAQPSLDEKFICGEWLQLTGETLKAEAAERARGRTFRIARVEDLLTLEGFEAHRFININTQLLCNTRAPEYRLSPADNEMIRNETTDIAIRMGYEEMPS